MVITLCLHYEAKTGKATAYLALFDQEGELGSALSFVPTSKLEIGNKTVGRLIPNQAQKQTLGRQYKTGEVLDLTHDKRFVALLADTANTWAFPTTFNQDQWTHFRSLLQTMTQKYQTPIFLGVQPVNSSHLAPGIGGVSQYRTENNSDESQQQYGHGSKGIHFLEELLSKVGAHVEGFSSLADLFEKAVPSSRRYLSFAGVHLSKEGHAWRSEAEFAIKAIDVLQKAQQQYGKTFHTLRPDQQKELLNIGDTNHGDNYFRKFVETHSAKKKVVRALQNLNQRRKGEAPKMQILCPEDSERLLAQIRDTSQKLASKVSYGRLSQVSADIKAKIEQRKAALAASNAEATAQTGLSIGNDVTHEWQGTIVGQGETFTDISTALLNTAPLALAIDQPAREQWARVTGNIQKMTAFLVHVLPHAASLASEQFNQASHKVFAEHQKQLNGVQTVNRSSANITHVLLSMVPVGPAPLVVALMTVAAQAGIAVYKQFMDSISKATFQGLNPELVADQNTLKTWQNDPFKTTRQYLDENLKQANPPQPFVAHIFDMVLPFFKAIAPNMLENGRLPDHWLPRVFDSPQVTQDKLKLFTSQLQNAFNTNMPKVLARQLQRIEAARPEIYRLAARPEVRNLIDLQAAAKQHGDLKALEGPQGTGVLARRSVYEPSLNFPSTREAEPVAFTEDWPELELPALFCHLMSLSDNARRQELADFIEPLYWAGFVIASGYGKVYDQKSAGVGLFNTTPIAAPAAQGSMIDQLKSRITSTKAKLAVRLGHESPDGPSRLVADRLEALGMLPQSIRQSQDWSQLGRVARHLLDSKSLTITDIPKVIDGKVSEGRMTISRLDLGSDLENTLRRQGLSKRLDVIEKAKENSASNSRLSQQQLNEDKETVEALNGDIDIPNIPALNNNIEAYRQSRLNGMQTTQP